MYQKITRLGNYPLRNFRSELFAIEFADIKPHMLVHMGTGPSGLGQQSNDMPS